MTLHYNEKSKTTHSPEGVDIYVPNFGDTYSVENLDPTSNNSIASYFKEISDFLVNELGYIRNETLFAAPYDFRKAPSRNYFFQYFWLKVHAEISSLNYYKLIFLDEHDKFFADLKVLVEKAYEINGGAQVTIVGHSMGGRMSLIFLQMQTQEWKDKYIKSFISLATPWGGSFKSVKALIYGDDFGLGGE